MPTKKAQKRKASDEPAVAAPAPAQKTRPHRTPQTPFEKSEETVYAVDKMVGMRWSKGSREYLVRWEGYSASHDTWEPMENLVGCAQQIREYEQKREKEAGHARFDRRERARQLRRALLSFLPAQQLRLLPPPLLLASILGAVVGQHDAVYPDGVGVGIHDASAAVAVGISGRQLRRPNERLRGAQRLHASHLKRGSTRERERENTQAMRRYPTMLDECEATKITKH
jgi:hypothetical protein